MKKIPKRSFQIYEIACMYSAFNHMNFEKNLLFLFVITPLQVYIGQKYKVVKVNIEYPKDSIDPIGPSYLS